MEYPKSDKYAPLLNEFIMGPNPLKLAEELMHIQPLQSGSLVMDLGSGKGLTSAFFAKEYGLRVFAVDLWISATESKQLFDRLGLGADTVVPIHADANELPFAEGFFDAVVSVDSYNYFGRDPQYLDSKLLPFVKKGGYICIAIPGMKKDCHNNIPPELLLSWTPEQLDYIHDVSYWSDMVSRSSAEVVSVSEMQGGTECWNDWLACDNEYARGDRAAMEGGGDRHMNFISIVLKKK